PAFAAPVAAGLQKADRCPCSASTVSSAGRASASQSLGTKLSAEPRTRRKTARTLSALNFPVCVPSIRTCRLDGTFLTVWSGQADVVAGGLALGESGGALKDAADHALHVLVGVKVGVAGQQHVVETAQQVLLEVCVWVAGGTVVV